MSDKTEHTFKIKISDRIAWIDKRCGLSEIQKDYVSAQMKEAVRDALMQANETTKEDSRLPIADVGHRYFVVAYTGENSKGSFLGSVDIDCTGGYPSSASVIEYIKGLKSKPNNVIITDMRELTEEDYLAWCGANDA